MSISQFRTLSDIYKLRSQQFAKALIDVMVDMNFEKLAASGLNEQRCREILQARDDALAALEIEKNGN